MSKDRISLSVVVLLTLLTITTLLNAYDLLYLGRIIAGSAEKGALNGQHPAHHLRVDLSPPFQHPYMEDAKFGLSDRPEAIAAWDMLLSYHNGFLYDGVPEEEHRYLISMFHQLHCLRSFKETFHQALSKEVFQLTAEEQEHVGHCLNYLIQGVLCAADTTLEWQTQPIRAGTGPFVNHTCRDWTKVYKSLEDMFWP